VHLCTICAAAGSVTYVAVVIKHKVCRCSFAQASLLVRFDEFLVGWGRGRPTCYDVKHGST